MELSGRRRGQASLIGYLELERKCTHNSNKPDQVHGCARGHGLLLLLAICALTDLAISGLNLSKLAKLAYGTRISCLPHFLFMP